MQYGIFLTKSQFKKEFDAYKQSTTGIDAYKSGLEEQWMANGGFIYNCLGIPCWCDPTLIKDLGNRDIQNAGHMILLLFIYYIDKFRKEEGIEHLARPWNVDIHDATIWEVHDDAVDKMVNIFKRAMEETNNYLQGDIPHQGDVDIGTSFADFKED